MKIKRKYIIVFASAFVFLAACAALFYMKFRVKYDGEIGRAGGGLIKINRSAEGFPVVELDDKSDIYFALGFLHAQDRLPVIEYYRSIVSSESSSVISDPDAALILDRIVAAFRIESAAKACVVS